MQINKGDKIQVFGYDTTFVVKNPWIKPIGLIGCHVQGREDQYYEFPRYKVEKVL